MKEMIVYGGKLSISVIGLCTIFYSVTDLMNFLSNPNYYKVHAKSDNKVKWTWSLVVNAGLLALFALQHSICATSEVKAAFKRYGMQDIQRSVYVILTSLSCIVLVKNWHYITAWNLWSLSMDNQLIFWIFPIMHVLSWLFIYIGTICMDINELVGLKQVFYAIKKVPDPLKYKTLELQSLYAHMRHPSFLGFVIILWFVPVMRLDRILLASFLTLYMYFAWKTDASDLAYQKVQFRKKFQ